MTSLTLTLSFGLDVKMKTVQFYCYSLFFFSFL